MSVDKLRGSKHINRISPSDIGLLMSAQSYRPEITHAIRKIKSLNWRSLQEIVVNTISPGPHPKYGGTYPCLKTKNVVGLLATHKPADYADASVFKDLNKVTVKKGDLLINLTGAGSIGRVAVYYGDDKPITNQHIARMSVKTSTDEGYLACFLRSWWGERALEQGVAGSTGQINMVNEHVRSIPVYLPDTLAQKYIGEKVRQAEQLRAWAKQVVSNLQREFEGFYRPITRYNSFRRMSYPIRPDQLFEVLTPASYPPHIEKYFEENPNVTLGEICSDIYIGKTLASIESSDGVKQATSRSCSGLFLKQPMNLVERKGNVEPLAKKDILLTNAAHDKNYIGKDVSFNHSDELILPSAKVLVIRLKECGIPASYVHAYLMTEAGYTQWQAIVRGISAGIHPSDVARIRVPVPENRALLETMAMKADDLYIQAGLAQEVSRLLTIAAKNLVEALIEGQLTEQQLIQAQQTLDDGDNGLDQAILSKLSTEGYAIKGATPLFTDIDELYRLLESAAQAESEE
ncbi:restriction endonuclease subunit S [Shewanella fidelis]|uniref:Restriction endonuclease subunit S n=1 Tax=Shewanella fidelis TaxID=173509 RepID=A0AAW8NU86_9GAMM|nr:restriction endonuclease subunit S [Shewanella fidelis]MDR8525454.1 restriction endonuclease subunit S [Shewanella fidelis]MDW4816893.1 restriction endonuclease subunit S [Shewanella fidelis]MDW4825692.1 restriction endonuclease subunit S [Shewanella fidelis]